MLSGFGFASHTGCPGAHYMNQTDPVLIEIYCLYPPRAKIKDVYRHTCL